MVQPPPPPPGLFILLFYCFQVHVCMETLITLISLIITHWYIIAILEIVLLNQAQSLYEWSTFYHCFQLYTDINFILAFILSFCDGLSERVVFFYWDCLISFMCDCFLMLYAVLRRVFTVSMFPDIAYHDSPVFTVFSQCHWFLIFYTNIHFFPVFLVWLFPDDYTVIHRIFTVSLFPAVLYRYSPIFTVFLQCSRTCLRDLVYHVLARTVSNPHFYSNIFTTFLLHSNTRSTSGSFSEVLLYSVRGMGEDPAPRPPQ